MENDVKKLIDEEIKNILKENGILEEELSPEQQKKTIVQNVNKHLRLLKYLKSTVKQIKMPEEFSKMAELLKGSNTADFLTQFLGVKDDIPVKVNAVLQNPLELIQAVVDEIINVAYKNARQKLQESKEGDLPFLARDAESYKNKHDKKLKQKGLKEPPPPIIDPALYKESTGLKMRDAHNLIQKLEKKAANWENIENNTEDEKQKVYAGDMAKRFREKVDQLRQKFGLQPKPEFTDDDIFETARLVPEPEKIDKL